MKQAVKALNRAIKEANNASLMDSLSQDQQEIIRAGVIQHFEFTFELAWKILKRYLDHYSPERIDFLTNRDLFRVGFEQGLIQDVKAWFNYLEKRNLTRHAYQQTIAAQVYEICGRFLDDVNYLLEQMEKRVHD